MIENYNENIRQYNNNMRDLITVYSSTIQDSRETNHSIWNHSNRANQTNQPIIINTPINSESRPTNRWSDYLFQFRSANPIQLNNTDFENVIIRPTSQQIILATEIIIWSEDFSQNSCPITLEQFTEGQTICRIRTCGHAFQTIGLMRWFERNVRCPVCRYDIREFNSMNELEEVEELEESSELENIIDSIDNYSNEDLRIQNQPSTTSTTNLSNMLRNLISNELNRNVPTVNNTVNDILYSLNIPIEMDISYSNI